MSTILVNCRNLPFASTLGVAHALLQLCRSLHRGHELIFVADDPDSITSSPQADSILGIASDVVASDEVSRTSARFLHRAIELQPHHFQEREFCERSVAVCFDLHVFDIAWKYGAAAETMQERLRRSLLGAQAVMTMFPRTYYYVESIAGITLPNLFLTESPLLLDTTVAASRPPKAHGQGTHRLLYPAQLQAHKNHRALIEGLRRAIDNGVDATIVCPGSDFDAGYSRDLDDRVQAADLGERITFPGRVTDEQLVAMYGECDSVIVPSLAEGGAYVALEAIAAGRPVAVNEIQSARMHVDAMRGSVRWFDASDPDEIAAAIADLVGADPADHLVANAECRSKIEQVDWDLVARRWDDVLGMVEGRRPRPTLRIDRLASEIGYT